jgi:hypothetical protein
MINSKEGTARAVLQALCTGIIIGGSIRSAWEDTDFKSLGGDIAANAAEICEVPKHLVPRIEHLGQFLESGLTDNFSSDDPTSSGKGMSKGFIIPIAKAITAALESHSQLENVIRRIHRVGP